MKEYKVNSFIWHCEEDNFENGCDPETSETNTGEMGISSNKLTDVLEAVKLQLGCKNNDEIELNACEEDGRIDFQFMSLKPFSVFRASDKSLSKFRSGDINLYFNCVSVYVDTVEQLRIDPTILTNQNGNK